MHGNVDPYQDGITIARREVDKWDRVWTQSRRSLQVKLLRTPHLRDQWWHTL